MNTGKVDTMGNSDHFALLKFLIGSMDLLFYDLYGRVLTSIHQKERLRVAVIGVDHSILEHAEALSDFGITICDYFAGDPYDIFHPSKSIQELESSQYDLLIVGGNSQAEEDTLLQELSAHFSGDKQLTCPILLMRRFRAGVKNALAKASRVDTCLNVRKLGLIALALFCTYDGCIVECGSFKGGTTVFMGLLLREWGDMRRMYAFDTFAGMPEPTASDRETIYQTGLFTETSLESVGQYVAEHGLTHQATLVKGLVQDTLPEVLVEEPKISFALVDTDQYQGTLASLKLIVPKLQENGIILVDDYQVEGVNTAVSEIRKLFPMLGGAEMSMNFYMLWGPTNRGFLSSCQMC